MVAAKVSAANGSPKLFAEIEDSLYAVATAKLAGMIPVDENVLGMAMMLLSETKRLRAKYEG